MWLSFCEDLFVNSFSSVLFCSGDPQFILDLKKKKKQVLTRHIRCSQIHASFVQWLAGNFPIRRLSHQHNPWSFPWDTNSQLSKNQSLRLHPIGTTLADLSRKFAPIHQRTQCKTIISLDFNYESTIACFHSFKLNHYDTNGTVKIVCLGFYISRFHTTSYSPGDIFLHRV